MCSLPNSSRLREGAGRRGSRLSATSLRPPSAGSSGLAAVRSRLVRAEVLASDWARRVAEHVVDAAAGEHAAGSPHHSQHGHRGRLPGREAQGPAGDGKADAAPTRKTRSTVPTFLSNFIVTSFAMSIGSSCQGSRRWLRGCGERRLLCTKDLAKHYHGPGDSGGSPRALTYEAGRRALVLAVAVTSCVLLHASWSRAACSRGATKSMKARTLGATSRA